MRNCTGRQASERNGSPTWDLCPLFVLCICIHRFVTNPKGGTEWKYKLVGGQYKFIWTGLDWVGSLLLVTLDNILRKYCVSYDPHLLPTSQSRTLQTGFCNISSREFRDDSFWQSCCSFSYTNNQHWCDHFPISFHFWFYVLGVWSDLYHLYMSLSMHCMKRWKDTRPIENPV